MNKSICLRDRAYSTEIKKQLTINELYDLVKKFKKKENKYQFIILPLSDDGLKKLHICQNNHIQSGKTRPFKCNICGKTFRNGD